MKSKLMIFDLDGTLYKTEKTSVPALKDAFSEFDIPLSRDQIIKQFGEPMDSIIENLTPDEKMHLKDKIKAKIAMNEQVMISSKAELYDGIKDTLEELEEEDHELAICSNGREDYITEVLRTTSIQDHFSTIKSHTEGRSKADLIEELIEETSREKGLMIGDRYHDIEAAGTAGIPSIGVKYGYGGKEVEKADFTVSHPKEIPPLVNKDL